MKDLVSKLKAIASKIRVPKIRVPKIKMPKIIIPEKLHFKYLLNKTGAIVYKFVKGLVVWLVKAIKESIAQIFTLLGFFIAWLTLTGTAQQMVGIATLAATAIWLITIPMREDKDK